MNNKNRESWKTPYQRKGIGFSRVQFEITDRLKDKLYKVASEQQLSFNSYMRLVCEQLVKPRESKNETN